MQLEFFKLMQYLPRSSCCEHLTWTPKNDPEGDTIAFESQIDIQFTIIIIRVVSWDQRLNYPAFFLY